MSVRATVEEARQLPFKAETKKFAANNGCKARSVIVRVCKEKSYFGLVPVRRANGRLLWPDCELVQGGAA